MDFDRSSFRKPIQITIDHTTPAVEVDVSDSSAPLTAGAGTTCGPPTSSNRPQAIYSLLDVPISTTKAVRIGCWSKSPINSDALKGKICPNLLEDEWWPTKYPLPLSFPPPSGNIILPVQISPTCFIGPNRGEIVEYNGSEFITVTDPEKYDPSQECPPSGEIPEPGSFYVTDETDRTWIVDALKEDLKRYEIMFKSQYCYGTGAYGSTDPYTGAMEDRHCITALSDKTISWKEKSSGIMWVGVYGMDDICVVTLSGHVDRSRLCGCLANLSSPTVLSIFRKCVLSELEDLADPPSKLREELDRSFDMPFCVVSATPGTPDESGHETSSVAHPDDAVSFVRGSGLLEQAKDSGGAIKLAISAFERLMGKKFEAEEIEVTVLFGRNFGTGYMRELDISEIGDYLGAVEAI